MVVTCADCSVKFETKRDLVKHVDYCGSECVKLEKDEVAESEFEQQAGESLQGEPCEMQGKPKMEHDLKGLILDCKDSLNSLLKDDKYRVNEGCDKVLPGRSKPSNEKVYNCNECQSPFRKQVELLSHLETHNPEKMYKCPECSRGFSYFWSLNSHLAKIHSKKRSPSCLECGEYCCSISGLDCTVLDGLGENILCCIDCPMRSQRVKKSERSRQCTVSCEFCTVTFVNPVGYRSHMITCSALLSARYNQGKKSMKYKPYPCDFCGKRFGSPANRALHTRIHTGEKPYSCHICNRKFRQRVHHLGHMRLHSGEKPYSCDFCDMKFSQNGNKKSHMMVHTGEKPYMCNVCNKSFIQQTHLVTHKRMHTGEKPYSCDVCERKFARFYHLKVHVNVHNAKKVAHRKLSTGEKPHSCNICKKNFARPSHLIVHMKTHTGEKTHACDICEKKFTTSGSAAVHRRTHTGEKPYSCNACKKNFTRAYSLTLHLKTHKVERILRH